MMRKGINSLGYARQNGEKILAECQTTDPLEKYRNTIQLEKGVKANLRRS